VGKGRKKQVGYEDAVDLLPAAESAVIAASVAYTQAYDEALAALARCNAVVNVEGAALKRAQEWRDRVRAAVDMGQGLRVPEVANVENPHITDGLREGEGAPAAAFITAHRNLAVLIGSLARIDGCSKAQIEAAAKYRSIYERAQLGGSKATDYSAAKVDTSGPSEDMVAVIGATARADYADAVRHLGMRASNLVERIVVHEHSLRAVAIALELGDSGGARKKARAMLFDALNHLVDHFRLRPNASKPKHWNDGSETHYSGEMVNPVRPLAA
jgi:hypothetical protein